MGYYDKKIQFFCQSTPTFAQSLLLATNGKIIAAYVLTGANPLLNIITPVDSDLAFRCVSQVSGAKTIRRTRLIPAAIGVDEFSGFAYGWWSAQSTNSPGYLIGSYPTGFYYNENNILVSNNAAYVNPGLTGVNVSGCHIINRPANNVTNFRYVNGAGVVVTLTSAYEAPSTKEFILDGIIDNDGVTVYPSSINPLEFAFIANEGLTVQEETDLRTVINNHTF